MIAVGPLERSADAQWPPYLSRRGAVAAIILLVMFADSMFDQKLLQWLPIAWWSSPWTSIALYVYPALAGCLVMPLLGRHVLRGVVGHRPTGLGMTAGCICALFGLGLFNWHRFWGYMAWPVPLPSEYPPPAAGFSMALSIVFVGPLMEEWLYRGLLWHAARKVTGPAGAIMITTFAFTIGHGPSRTHDFPVLALFGIVLGALRHRTASLSPTILAHSMTNLGLIAFM